MLDDQDFEEKYLDVLQNIEFGIVNVYRQDRQLTDWDALDAIEALVRRYTAEARGRPQPNLRLSELSQRVFDSVEIMCEWRLGRKQFISKDEQPFEAEMEPKTVPEIIDCLKRVRKSIRRWNKVGGRQGYLDFISEFIP